MYKLTSTTTNPGGGGGVRAAQHTARFTSHSPTSPINKRKYCVGLFDPLGVHLLQGQQHVIAEKAISERRRRRRFFVTIPE